MIAGKSKQTKTIRQRVVFCFNHLMVDKLINDYKKK
jgi:hypothetical protein